MVNGREKRRSEDEIQPHSLACGTRQVEVGSREKKAEEATKARSLKPQ
jgi:hypothetical protein